jgi:uncharacterized protein YcbX
VKSCGWLETPALTVGEAGPQVTWGSRSLGDRQWLFVDADGKFLTQRTHPRLALIQPQLEGSRFTLRIQDHEYKVPEVSLKERMRVQVWGKSVDSARVSKEIDLAASYFLGKEVHLVEFDSLSKRDSLLDGRSLGVQTRFTDSQAYLVVTEESLKELNSRLSDPVGIERFRPNIVLRGALDPFDEDRWSSLGGGGIRFEKTKRCARCSIITVDQAAGKVHSPEPLKVLSHFRRDGSSVYFGQYFYSTSFGQVLKVGDLLDHNTG